MPLRDKTSQQNGHSQRPQLFGEDASHKVAGGFFLDKRADKSPQPKELKTSKILGEPDQMGQKLSPKKQERVPCFSFAIF